MSCWPGSRAGLPAADAELAVVAAADELAQGSLEAAERYLALAERQSASVPAGRRGHTGGCCSGWSGCCWPASAGTCRRWPRKRGSCRPWPRSRTRRSPAWARTCSALALISLGSTEFWATASEDAERYLDRGIALARRIGRPYLEFTGLAYQAAHEAYHSFARAAERGRQAVELAERHGWTGDPAAGIACIGSRSRAGLAGTAGCGRAVGPARRAHPHRRHPARGRAGDPPPPRDA